MNQRSPQTRKKLTVLGATSGDTGSAAIEGLRGKRDIEVYILHPKGRTAPIQEAQMTTVLDPNVHNISIEGTFDDCQKIVKDAFGDVAFREKHALAAVNSINWARILAQIVYYFYAYFRAKDQRKDKLKPVTFVVPTGNFGDALACFYARQMGLDVEVMCTTNANDIVHRFFSAADYTARPVVPTLAPAMDIVVPSNFERFLFHLLNDDPVALSEIAKQIKETKSFKFADNEDEIMARARAIFSSSRSSDEEIKETIEVSKANHSYVPCPHTATALHGVWRLPFDRRAQRTFVCLATAHPGKFGDGLEVCRDAQLKPSPALQLEGLMEKERRCAHLPNSGDSVRAVIEEAEARRDASESTWTVSMVPLVAAVFGGIIIAVNARRSSN